MAWNKQTRTTYPFLLIWVLCVLLRPGVGRAQDQYQGIPVPPYEFYDALLTTAQFTESKEVSRMLFRMVGVLSPLFDAIQTNLGQDARSPLLAAINKKMAPDVYRAVLKLIYLDMRLNLKMAKTEHEIKEKKERLLAAYVNYTFLSSNVVERNGTLDGEIKGTLRRFYHMGSAEWSDQAIKIELLMDRMEKLLFG